MIDTQFGKFVIKGFLFLMLVFISDQISGRLLYKIYFSTKSGPAYRTTYAMDSTDAEILVFGSSRANHHYVPEVFRNSFGLSYYNTGRDGNYFLYSYAILKVILKRHIPEIIIYDINPEEFYYDPSSYDRLSTLLPYYSKHPEIRDIILKKGPYEELKLCSKIYPFNSQLLTIGLGFLEKDRDENGYIPLKGIMQESTPDLIKKPAGVIDKYKIQILDSIATLCKKLEIKLFICNSPTYSSNYVSEIDTIIGLVVSKYNFRYYNFSNNIYFYSHPDLFADQTHLNEKGALIYSSMVVDSLEEGNLAKNRY